MGSRNEHRSSNPTLKNPSSKRKSLAPSVAKNKRIKNKKKKKKNDDTSQSNDNIQSGSNQNSEDNKELQPVSASEQLRFFLDQFQSAKGVQLSSLELESLKETCLLDLSQDTHKDINSLAKNIKAAFGESWKEVLCEGKLVEGKIDAGSPAVLIICSSALRSIELLRGFRSLTEECHAVKLFSKHMKVEEQPMPFTVRYLFLSQNMGNDAKFNIFSQALVMLSGFYIWHVSLVQTFSMISLLKSRVNIACGTPSRIKKLIDSEALGLSRLRVLLFDMHPDVKGYSLFTLPQVRDEFWDLFKTYFYQPMVQGDLRICLWSISSGCLLKGKRGLGNPNKSKV